MDLLVAKIDVDENNLRIFQLRHRHCQIYRWASSFAFIFPGLVRMREGNMSKLDNEDWSE